MTLFSAVYDSFAKGLHALRSVSFVADQVLRDIDFTRVEVSDQRSKTIMTTDDISDVIFEEGSQVYVDDAFFESAIVGRMAVRAFDHHLIDDDFDWDSVRVEVSGGKVKYTSSCGTQFGWGMVSDCYSGSFYRFWVFCPSGNPMRAILQRNAHTEGWGVRCDLEADLIMSETIFPFQSKL